MRRQRILKHRQWILILRQWIYKIRGIGQILLIFCLFSLGLNNLFASDTFPKEKLERSEAMVYETIEYSIQWEDGMEVSLPSLGELTPEGSELSYGEILSVDLGEKEARIRLRYFLPGEFFMPVSWKPSFDGATIDSQKTVKVVSSIQEGESEVEADAIAPVEFGNFLWSRFILILIVFMGIVFGFFYIYSRWKRRPLDAIIETRPPIPEEEKWNQRIQTFFKSEIISKKEFAFFLTDYLKWKLSTALEKDLSNKKDSQLLELIFNRSPIAQEDLREAKWFFLVAKYTPYTESFSLEDARAYWDKWDKIISGIDHVRI